MPRIDGASAVVEPPEPDGVEQAPGRAEATFVAAERELSEVIEALEAWRERAGDLTRS